MKKIFFSLMILSAALVGNTQNNKPLTSFEKDSFETTKGKLTITFVGHASLMLETENTVIHVDPTMAQANYALFPKADLILITHEHDDHLDKTAVDFIKKPDTKIVVSKSCDGKFNQALVLKNDEEKILGDFDIKTVPAYNIVNTRNGTPFHPKGNGNGYVISYGGKTIYIAGDTENIPEMANLKNIDIAFLPMNLPYTMTPQMVADGARSFMPKILYPYHTGETNVQLLVDLLKNSNMEVRVRKLK